MGKGSLVTGLRRIWRGFRVVSVVTGMALTGIGVYGLATDDAAETAPTTTARRATSTEALADDGPSTRACVNPVLGYSVDIPETWFAAGTDEDGPCRFFNPEPFEVPEFGEVAVAMSISLVPDTLDSWVRQFDDSSIFLVIEREEVLVANRRAVRLHYEHAEGGVEPGAESYEVFVDWDVGVLGVSAFEPFSADFAATRRVVDDVATSLREVP